MNKKNSKTEIVEYNNNQVPRLSTFSKCGLFVLPSSMPVKLDLILCPHTALLWLCLVEHLCDREGEPTVGFVVRNRRTPSLILAQLGWGWSLVDRVVDLEESTWFDPHKSSLVVHAWNLSTGALEAGEKEVQVHPWLCMKFEVNLKYVRPWLGNKQKNCDPAQ